MANQVHFFRCQEMPLLNNYKWWFSLRFRNDEPYRVKCVSLVARRKCCLLRFLLNINRGQCLNKQDYVTGKGSIWWKSLFETGWCKFCIYWIWMCFKTSWWKYIMRFWSTSKPNPNCNVQYCERAIVAALLPQGLDSLLSSMAKLIPKVLQ